MDRVTRRIVGYVALIASLTAAILVLLPWPLSGRHLVVAALLLLLPGRLQGFLWRDFFRGRHATTRQDFESAEEHFVLFLNKLQHQPRLRSAVFLAWNFYTWNAEAMTRNNIGVCRLNRGELHSEPWRTRCSARHKSRDGPQSSIADFRAPGSSRRCRGAVPHDSLLA
jgi:hypothetical protein